MLYYINLNVLNSDNIKMKTRSEDELAIRLQPEFEFPADFFEIGYLSRFFNVKTGVVQGDAVFIKS